MKPKQNLLIQKFKDKLLSEMVRQGLNGQKLAKLSGVSDSEISRIRSGDSTPGLENAFRLARALGVSLDYLADDRLETDPAQATDPSSSEEREVLALAHAIGCTQAARALENIRFIGYEAAMARLLNAKPIIEVDTGDRSASAPPASPPASRASSA